MDELDDFEISKYLKTKIKNQWLEKHKKMKDLRKTGFRAHQGFASQIISNHAKTNRFKHDKEPGGNIEENHYANDGVSDKADSVKRKVEAHRAFLRTKGNLVVRDNEIARKITLGTKKEFRIGFSDYIQDD